MVDRKDSYIDEIKNCVLSQYPTTIRRLVSLSNIISFDHSVNRWLFERWLENYSVESELKALQQEMTQQIVDYLNDPAIQIQFVHLDPRTTKHARASY